MASEQDELRPFSSQGFKEGDNGGSAGKPSSFSQLSGTQSSSVEKQDDARNVITADGVSRFVENLIRKNIVSRKTVNDAAAWKKAHGDNEKRHLFQVLIDKYEVDREQVYNEFV